MKQRIFQSLDLPDFNQKLAASAHRKQSQWTVLLRKKTAPSQKGTGEKRYYANYEFFNSIEYYYLSELSP